MQIAAAMYKRILSGLVCFTLVCWLLAGNWACQKPDVYPVEPHLEYLGYAAIGDSIVFRLSFTDGDGDIGLSDADTLPPFDSKSKHYKNLRLYYQYLDSAKGKFSYFVKPKTTNDTLIYDYRIARINKTGSDKSLNGEIQVFLPSLYYYPTHKIIRFECQLEDRALHESNKVISPQIVTH